jgi:ribosomal protein S18 acetylase RimI-like enzyme
MSEPPEMVPGFRATPGSDAVTIHELRAADVDWAREFLVATAGSAHMVSRGRLHQCHQLPGFYTEDAGRRTALLTYRIERSEMEVVTLYASDRGRGYGTALLAAARDRARAEACRRLWLITTNDNTPALRFYRNRGLRQVAVHAGAVDQARRELKPEIPLYGLDGVRIRDEIELELLLEPVLPL